MVARCGGHRGGRFRPSSWYESPSSSAAKRPQLETWMVKRSENGNLGGLWLEGHGLSVGPGTMNLSSRVRGAAPSRQMQSDEPVVSRYGAAKTATLTMLARPAPTRAPNRRGTARRSGARRT